MEYIVLDKTSNSICINYPANSRNNIARTIKIPDDVAKLLDEYIYENNIKEGPVFINKRKNRMQLRDSERLIEKYCKIKKILIVYTNMCMHVYNIEVII